MKSYKLERLTEDIKRAVSAVLREIKDPRVSGNLISVVRVDVTRDLSFCTVFFSVLGGEEKAKAAMQGLESAKGYLRREMGARLDMRQVPVLIFKVSDAIEYSAKVDKIIRELKDNNGGN